MNNGYAYSLFELGLENKNIDLVFDAFKDFYENYQANKDLSLYLESLVIDAKEKKELIEKILVDVPLDFKYFLFVLADNDEYKHLEEIYLDFKKGYYDFAHKKEVVILSKEKIKDDERMTIKNLLDKKYPDDEIIIVEKLSQDIIDGFEIYVDNKKISASLKALLDDFKIRF